MKRYPWTVVAVFTVIAGISLVSLLKPPVYYSEHERRFLAQKPQWKISGIFSGDFTGDYEAYLSDQFPFRDAWISLRTASERVLGKKESNGVYLADDGYLIERHTREDMDETVFRENIERTARFVKQAEEITGKGKVKIMLVPSADSILTDKLPAFAVGLDQSELMSRVRQALPDQYVDAASILRKHREEEIYYRTDHHWTTLGAWYGYQAWAQETGVTAWPAEAWHVEEPDYDFYGTVYSKVHVKVPPDRIQIYIPAEEISYEVNYNDGERITGSLYAYDKLGTRDGYEVFLNGNQPLVKITRSKGEAAAGAGMQTNDTAGNLLVIKDSYANCMIPFLVNHFNETHVMDLRYLWPDIPAYIRENDITDVLILYQTVRYSNSSLYRLEHGK